MSGVSSAVAVRRITQFIIALYGQKSTVFGYELGIFFEPTAATEIAAEKAVIFVKKF